MKDKDKNLYYLKELSDYKVADNYDDVRNWDVVDGDHRVIGKVSGLLVSKEAERVVYLDVEVDASIIEAGHQTYAKPASEGVHEFLNAEGENHLIIPIGVVNLEAKAKKVHCKSVNYSTFEKTKRFMKGADLSRSYEQQVMSHYLLNAATDQDYDAENEFYSRSEFIPAANTNDGNFTEQGL